MPPQRREILARGAAHAPADAETRFLRSAGCWRDAVRRGGDFAAHGRVSDHHAGYRDDACSTARLGAGTSSEFSLVIFGLRLPRIALGILVGASLSTAGAGFQALLRNPLADPYVLGVSSGAALGAMLSLIIAPHSRGRDSAGGVSSARRRRLRRFIFWGGAAGSWTAPRCCSRESWRRRFFRRSLFF